MKTCRHKLYFTDKKKIKDELQHCTKISPIAESNASRRPVSHGVPKKNMILEILKQKANSFCTMQALNIIYLHDYE